MATPNVVTIRDVAHAAGVSVATVSNALTGRRPVNPETAARVRGEAARLGYRVNRAARSLRTSRTDTIAICLSNSFQGGLDLSNDYLMQIVRAATDTAFAANQRVLLSPELASPGDASALGVDGALIMDPGRRDPQIDYFGDLGIPVITIERDPGRPEHSWVVRADNDALLRTLLDHVWEVGARCPSLIVRASEVRDFPWEDELEAAYRAWCDEHGITPDVVFITGLEQFTDQAAEVIHTLLTREDVPDAVITTFEFDGVTVARTARDLGIRIPDELLVAVANDGTLARASRPALTAMDLLPLDQAAAAVELLMARIEGRPAEPPPPVQAQLRIRESTALS